MLADEPFVSCYCLSSELQKDGNLGVLIQSFFTTPPEVEPYRLEATSCYRAWLAAGKLRQGVAQEARLCSHTQFRYAVRKVKRASRLHKARGLFGSAMSGDIELMKKMRRLKTGNGPMEELTDTVDGATGEQEFSGKFREVYEALYNSSPSDPEMTNLKVKI